MKLLNRVNVSRDKDGPRKFSFEMSMSGVISIGIVVVLGMCWVFILGILVGRGYRPEAAVPQIAQMMPTTEATPPDNTTPANPPSVLKPEELQFMEDTQGKDGDVVADSTQKTPADGKKVQPPKTDLRPIAPGTVPVTKAIAGAPASKTPPATPKRPGVEGSRSTAPTKTDPKANKADSKDKVDPKVKVDPKSTKADAAKTKAEATKATADKKNTGRFSATYQVASFPAKDQAESVVKKLAQKGITASIHEAKSNKSSVYRVTVQLKGSEAEITDGLKRTGEKGPILLGKKPL